MKQACLSCILYFVQEVAKVPFKPFDKNQLHCEFLEETQSIGPQASNFIHVAQSDASSTYLSSLDLSSPASGYCRDPTTMSAEEFEQSVEKIILFPIIIQSPSPIQDSIALSSIGSSSRDTFTSSTISEDTDYQLCPPSSASIEFPSSEENKRPGASFPFTAQRPPVRQQSLPNSFRLSEHSVYEQLSLKRPGKLIQLLGSIAFMY